VAWAPRLAPLSRRLPLRCPLDGREHGAARPRLTSSTFGRDRWPGEVHSFPEGDNHLAPTTKLGRSLILVQKSAFQRKVPHGQKKLNELRAEWSPVYTSENESMTLLAHRAASTNWGVPWWHVDVTRPLPPKPGGCGLSPYEPQSTAAS